MKLVSTHSFIILLFLAFSFSSCGDNNSNTSNESNSDDSDNVSSKSREFEKKPCELLTQEVIKKYITIEGPIKEEFVEYKEDPYPTAATCKYTWQKKAKELDVSDGGSNLDMKDVFSEAFPRSVSISIVPYGGSLRNFIPSYTYTDDEINEQLKDAERRMDEGLEGLAEGEYRKEQVKEAGEKTRKNMTELRDQVIKKEDIEEAAYFSPSSGDRTDRTLSILSNKRVVNIRVDTDASGEENEEIARKIAKEIL